MKIQVVQMKSVSGKLELNLQKMLSEIEKAKGYADVIVFPELCISGSMLMHYFKNSAVIGQLLDMNQQIIDASDDIMIIWGNVDQDFDEIFDTAYVAKDKKIIHKVHKQFNSTTNLEVKKQYFTHLQKKELETFKAFDRKMAVVVNNDLMVHDYHDTDIVFHLNTHYYRGVDTIQQKLTFINNIEATVISVNAVGIVNSSRFFGLLDGQSIIKHKQDIEILNSNFLEESKLVDLDDFVAENKHVSIPLIDALLFGIKQIDEEIFPFKPNWIVGLSGGLDSSVVAALLVMALGKDRVIGYNLATKHNSETTINNAQHLADVLGFEYHGFDITALVDATSETVGQKIDGLALENVQARIRGHVLMTMASLQNGVISNNSNKIESALGYGTLYGDTIGALGILADCTKMQVVELAQAINQRLSKEIINYNLLPRIDNDGVYWDFAPSAELKDNQIDPMKWGYHDFLIEWLISKPNGILTLLQCYLDGTLLDGQLGDIMRSYNLDDSELFLEDLNWVINSINKSVFKRVQGVPIIVVSNCVLGLDRLENQMPIIISDELQELIEKVRRM